jgi:exosome complex RNA-binding protein Csl4
MMEAKVIQLSGYKVKEETESTVTGKAVCVNCRYEWTAVAPTGVDWLECPECHLMKGRFFYDCVREDKEHWYCHCGNDLFYMTPDGMYCPNCGDWQTGYDR